MGSHQDFRSLQAKFQASQPETGDLPKKPPKPEFHKLLKKFPQPEPGEHPKKPPQPEFTDLPKKPPKLEFSELSKKFLQPEATPLPRKPEVPEAPSQKPPQQPELSNSPRSPVEHKFSTLPKKPQQPEFCGLPRKPPQPQAGGLPKMPLPQPESSEAPLVTPLKLEFGEPHPHSSEPNFSTLPKKPPQPEFCELPRKPPQPQVSGLPKKSLLQPESSDIPPVPLSKLESGEPHTHSSQPDFSTFPRKITRPQLNDLPKKPLTPEFGDLTRTSSEPEVSVVPKKPRQCEFKALSKKPPQPEPTSLSRTSSEPEFKVFPSKFLQPECRGTPRKFSQPEPGSLPRNLPRKPLLPGSFSESSLPSAVAGSSSRVPLSPGFRARQQRSGALAQSAGSRLGLRPGHLPRRRPLPPASSLGPPPAKPPLPPGPRDIQSFRRAAVADTALPRTSSSAGLHLIPQDPDEVYDDVEPTYHSGPGPRSRDEVLSAQQYPWRPPQDPELRREKVPLQPLQVPPTDLKSLKQLRKAEKAEREFRKKFKFEGEIVVQTRMMIDPNAKTRRGGGKYLAIRRGEILEVIEFTSKEEMLCRDTKGKYGYVPRTALLPLETEVYDDVAAWDPLDSQPLP